MATQAGGMRLDSRRRCRRRYLSLVPSLANPVKDSYASIDLAGRPKKNQNLVVPLTKRHHAGESDTI